MFKFIHAADIHLDSPLRGLEKYDEAPLEAIRLAARRALCKLVDLAIEEAVQFVVVAGDLYDGDWTEYNTGHFFVMQASRLREAHIPLFLIAGNHDAQNKMTRSLPLPSNTFLFPSDAPVTHRIDDWQVAIHGQSFATAAVVHDLSIQYPAALPGYFNLGVLHTSLTGRDGHDRYAPCSLDTLRNKGYDYWALGHIHQREIVCEQPFIAFSGNIQGRHAKETGPKGCFLVQVADHRIANVQFRELDVFRWESIQVAVDEAVDQSDVEEAIRNALCIVAGDSPAKQMAIRLELTGASAAHAVIHAQKQSLVEASRALGIDVGQGRLWIEKVILNTRPLREGAWDNDLDGAIGELRQIFSEVRQSLVNEGLSELEFTDLVKKLPGEFHERWTKPAPDCLQGILEEAELILLEGLLDDEARR